MLQINIFFRGCKNWQYAEKYVQNILNPNQQETVQNSVMVQCILCGKDGKLVIQ